MVNNRLNAYPEGERLSMLHTTLNDKCDTLGQSAMMFREMPDMLQTQIVALEAQVQEMRDAEVERLRQEALIDPNTAEKIALEKLAQAQAESEEKDSELRRMRMALQAARDELQKVSAGKAELKRELEAERAELHKLRQQAFVTQLPERIVSDAPAHGSPRQREHPELTSPRQDMRGQQRAQSASRSRSGAQPAPQQQHQRPFSARPIMHERYLDFGHTPYTAHIPYTPRDPVAAAAAAATAAAPTLSLQMPSPRGVSSSTTTTTTSAFPSPRQPAARRPPQESAGAEVACQTGSSELERQVRELQRTNAQLQTALLAQALDPGDLGGLLSAVDSSLTSYAGAKPRKGPRPQLVQARAPGSVASARGGGERQWPFPPGKGVPAAQLPRGFAVYPPQA